MRIAIVRRLPGITFSMDVYTEGLVTGLRAVRPDWEIVEITPRPWAKGKDLWKSGTGVKKYYERFLRHPREVIRQHADVFHVVDHSSGHVAYWLKNAGKPVIVTCHDLIQSVYPDNLRGQSKFPLLSQSVWEYTIRGMRSANHIITVSTTTKQDVQRILQIAADRMTVVPNAVDPQFQVLPPAAIEPLQQQYRPTPETFCLLNVGSCHPRKNIITVLRVLQLLKEQGLPIQLWKTGDDFTDEQKQFIYSHQLQQCITYLGKPNKQTLIQIYNAADLLLAPSLYEGFGLTILEAMACGTPVITSNVSSLPEVAGEAAILVEPMDVKSMVAAICQLSQNKGDRQTLIEEGLQRVQQFTWENTARQVAKVYESLVKP